MKAVKAFVAIAAVHNGFYCVSAMTEKATGISFADRLNGLELFGVGVRKKGPIKVLYSEVAFANKFNRMKFCNGRYCLYGYYRFTR